MADTKQYLLVGKDHDGFDEKGNRVRYEKNDLVPLTKEQFENFRDKFVEANEKPKVETKSVSPTATSQQPSQTKPA